MKLSTMIFGATAVLSLGASLAMAQQQNDKKGPPPPMSFFVTDTPKGDGANYGGVAGADQYCQAHRPSHCCARRSGRQGTAKH